VNDSSLRELVTEILEAEHHEVCAVSDGLEAFRLLTDAADVEFDLLLTDISMPGITGFELARAVVAFRPDLSILYISGTAASAMPPDGIVPAPLLQKPFRLADLLSAIDDCVRVWRIGGARQRLARRGH
jgi:two-component system cell cycle response regulator CpdR